MRSIRTTVALALVALVSLLVAAGATAAAPLSIKVDGNHFVDGEGRTIRLLGVNHPSFEYECVHPYGRLSDEHMDDADAAAIASWKANAVRVPLNEDCWLGKNGQPLEFSPAEYQAGIESYVAALHAHGLYAILDLHWTAPGNEVALEQQPMPDSKSAEFWSSIAATFKGDPAVVFDLFNEPFSPADERSGEDPAHPVSWDCWRNGGCSLQAYDEEGKATGPIYTAVGMQALVDSIRGAGATQPIMAGGLNYANDLSGWQAHEPSDPLGQLAASFHNYQGPGKCDDSACWDSQIAPIAASVPMVTGEFAQSGCYASEFDNEYMAWADAHGISYLGWAWIVLSAQDMADEGCDAYYLITDYGGTPSSVNGTAVRTHLLSLAPTLMAPAPVPTRTASRTAPPAEALRLTEFAASLDAAGTSIRFQIAASQPCAAAISGKTVKAFKLGRRKAHPVVLGAAHLSLNADKPASVSVRLPAKARNLLKARRSLPVRFTVTLRSAGAPIVIEAAATLTAPKPKRHRRRH